MRQHAHPCLLTRSRRPQVAVCWNGEAYSNVTGWMAKPFTPFSGEEYQVDVRMIQSTPTHDLALALFCLRITPFYFFCGALLCHILPRSIWVIGVLYECGVWENPRRLSDKPFDSYDGP